LVLAAAAAPAQSPPDSFSFDFRQGGPLPPLLHPFGRNAKRLIQPQAGGLRITLPANRGAGDGVGVSPRCAASGDFEIRVAYELLSVEPPNAGYGSGVFLYVALKSDREDAFTLARAHRQREGSVYLVNQLYRKGDKVVQKPRTFPTPTRSGQLCLRRVGAKVHYLVADGAGELREIAEAEVGKDDVQVIRLAANTGGSATGLDVRLFEFHLNAKKLPNAPAPPAGSGQSWLLAGGAVILGLGVVAGLLYWRWSRRPGAPGGRQPSPGAGTR
jgi:hypothetical protein